MGHLTLGIEMQLCYRVGGGVSRREGVPGHELLHQGEEQLEAQTRYEQTTTLA